MTRGRRTPSGEPSAEGHVAGYVLKLSRECLQLTQEDLAENLGVDKNTIQGWESGRRALTSTRVNNYIRVRNRLRALGADPQLLAALDLATEADCFLTHAVNAKSDDIRPEDHPLATWVVTRQFSEMLAWPFTKDTPSRLGSFQKAGRRGPVVSSPSLSREGQERFFEHLKAAAEKSLSPTEASSFAGVLLRRQAYYCLTWDRAPSTRAWLADMQRAEHTRIGVRFGGWSPLWVALRSLFVARARQGDKEPLRRFIERSLTGDDTCESANLNYWIYWIGESRTSEHSDAFMVKDLHCSAGLTLLRRLEENLSVSELLLDLYIHSIWALLQRRASLLAYDPGLAQALYAKATALLERADLSRQAKRELEHIHYGVAMIVPSARTRSDDETGSANAEV